MFAKSATASTPFKFGRNLQRTSFPFVHVNLHSERSNCSVKSTRRAKVVVRAGYTKRPLDTAGAYELIDDETGDKVIVWGGADDVDNDSLVPSKDVLTWKPSNGYTKGPRVLTGSFKKLNAHKVQSLARASSRKKEDAAGRPYDEKSEEHDEEDNGFDVADVRDIISRAAQPSKHQDRKVRVDRRDETDAVEVDNKHRVEESSSRSRNLKQPDNRNPNPKFSNSSLRSWSDGPSPQNNRYEPTEISKKWSKSTTDSDFFSRKSFREMGCSDYMIEALTRGFLSRPSHIQAMAFSPIVKGNSCIVADQSGSGKTLAYLLPLIQRLRQEELEGVGKSLPGSPRVVILVPTAELASQVLSNCRKISKCGVPFRSMVVTGGFKQKTQLDSIRQELDVLIATPGRFMFLLKEGFLQLKNLTCAVLDEVDILFNDEDFEPAFQNLMKSAPITAQYLFVTATLPVDVYNMLVQDFPDCEVVMGPGMHRTSPGLEEVLVDCSGNEGSEKTPETAFLNKKSALLRLAEESPVHKTIVFCNKIETCRKVENALKRFDRKGIRAKVLAFHAALDQESRLANMEEFRKSHSKDSSLFLVCTDRASRGIDFEGVNHVVLFDFPRDPSEYVRRVGRTARGAGGIGKAFVFVVGKQVYLARKIIDRNQKGHPLHDVPAAYEQFRS
jgi:ATP-dependent RNA helicase DDX18/HAS1